MNSLDQFSSRSKESSTDDEIDLGRLLGILWAKIIFIAIAVVIAGAIAFAYLEITPNTYQADALLQLEERGGQFSMPTGLEDLAGDAPRSVTEIAILKSRLVLGDVVARLNLAWKAEPRQLPVIGYSLTQRDWPVPDWPFLRPFARTQEHIELDLLDVPPRWLNKELILTKTGENSFSVTTPDGISFDGVVGEQLHDKASDFAIRVRTLVGADGREYIITHRSETLAINSVRGNFQASEIGRQSGVLEARYTAASRREAELVLNAIVQAYLKQNIERSSAEAKSSIEFLDQQLPSALARVTDAEARLNEYRQEQNSIDVTFETEALLTQIGQVEAELSEMAIREETLRTRYTPNHPTYKDFLAAKKLLEERLAALKLETESLPKTQRDVIGMTSELELAREVYLKLLNRFRELQVLEASTIGNVRVVDFAQAKPSPVSPRKSMILALGLLIGAMAGIAFVLLRNMSQRGIRSSSEIEAMGLSVFATVTSVPSSFIKRRRRDWPLLALNSPTHVAVEAFRSLRTSLHFATVDAKNNAIMLTSAAPEAGKSFCSANLAVVSAQAGQRVCLVDADMRRGQLRNYFDVRKNTPGLAEVLGEQDTREAVTLQTAIKGLDFITTGTYPPNPSELLMRPRFQKLVDELTKDYDLVVFDCPPTLAVTDPVIIARNVGTCMMVVRYDDTEAHQIEAVKNTFEAAGQRISGAIFNGLDQRAGGRSGYGQYGYRYTYKTR